MNPLKSEDSTAGIKIRRWQGDPPCEGLSNSSHAFETPLDHDGTPSPSDESAQDLQSTSDNGIPRSHSQELQSENHYEKGLLKTEKTKSQPTNMILQSATAASTPKRHHPSTPLKTPARDEMAPEKINQRNSKDPNTSGSFSLSINSAVSASLENGEHVKSSNSDCNLNATSPLGGNAISTGNGKIPTPALRQTETASTTSTSTTSANKAPTPGGSRGSNRNGSLLPRPGVSGPNPSTPMRSKTTSRSKKHSSRTNLYIRGLPKSMSENDLVSLVPDASAIRSVKLVVNNDGEGYGFIDFVSNEAALVAMQHIKLQNSSQYVNFAYESEKDPLNVYVTNIPESWNSENVETLKQIFSPYGKITSALVMTRRSTNTCTGTGFVRYLTSEEAQRAIDGIRKAKITLPGAKRPLELKLADRQRAREHKSESIGSENNNLPLFQQFMRDDAQQHLSQALKTQQHHNQMIDDIFNAASVSDRNIFDQAKVAGHVTSGVSLMSPSPVDMTPTSTDEIPTAAISQLTAPTIMPVAPAVAAATAAALAAPLYQFPCLPWIQQDPTAAHGNPTAAYIHPQLAASAAVASQKTSPPTAPLDLHSLAAIYQMAGLGVLNYGATAPAQSFDLILPLVNGQLNGHPIDASSLYPYGLNQPLWPKACFYG